MSARGNGPDTTVSVRNQDAAPTLTIVSYSRLERDPRVQRQIEEFVKDYEVTTIGYGPPPHPDVDHLRITDEARSWPDHKRHLIMRDHRRTHESVGAVKAARTLVRGRERPDIVLANDVNSLPFSLSLGARQGTHADLHEFSPREKEHDLKWRMFVSPYMRWICRTCLPRTASVTTVSPGLAEAYSEEYGVDVEVAMNAARYVESAPRRTGEPIRMLHTGAARANRSLEVLIDAMEGVDHATLDLVLVESEPGVIENLRRRAAHNPAVSFREPVPYTELVGMVSDYDVSIVFFPPTTFNLRHTLPNKLFEAVQGRNALVVSPSPDMAELVRDHGIGVVTADFSAGSLRAALNALDARTVDQMKEASDASAESLSSQRQVAVWRSAIDRIARGVDR